STFPPAQQPENRVDLQTHFSNLIARLRISGLSDEQIGSLLTSLRIPLTATPNGNEEFRITHDAAIAVEYWLKRLEHLIDGEAERIRSRSERGWNAFIAILTGVLIAVLTHLFDWWLAATKCP